MYKVCLVEQTSNKKSQYKLYNMVFGKDMDKNFGYRLAAYFVAPMSGNHIFTVSCNAKCNLYFKHGPNIDRTNYEVIELTSWTSRFLFDK